MKIMKYSEMQKREFDIISYIERIEEREERKDFNLLGNLISSLLIGIYLYVLIGNIFI